MARGAGGVTAASGWLVNLVGRGPGLAPDHEDGPPSAPGLTATHTMNTDSGLTAVDVRRAERRILARHNALDR